MLASTLVLACGSALAQDPSSQDPLASAIARAADAVARAEASDAPASPDAPVWAAAIDAARAAVEAGGEPPDADALAWLARAYQGAGWWIRAVDAWERLEEAHGPLAGEALRDWRDATVQLGYARYEAGDLMAAAERFAGVTARIPGDVEALRWSGRIALEQDRPEQAIASFERLLAEVPGDDGARYHLELARERVAHGRAASDAYRAGLAQLEAGRIDEAVAAFARAEEADPNWVEPARWRARALLEADRAGAVDAWRRVAELRPDDEGVAWFLARAELQAQVGRPALLASDEARAARERGDPEAALASWRRALELAPDWREARFGVARAATAAGDAEAALEAWSALREATPADDPAASEIAAGLATARLLTRLGPAAARDYVSADAAFERGDVDRAVELLRRVAEDAPDASEPWAFLGRIAFARGDWRAAAQAYERASDLAPADPDLAYFAREARALAGPEPVDPTPIAPLPPGDDAQEE